jgi:uncharacterized protein (DUF885 family)
MQTLSNPLLTLAAALLCLAACQTADRAQAVKPARSTDVSDQSAKLFADYYEERLRLSPLEATDAGDPRYNDQLPNELTEEVRAAQRAFYRKHLAAVKRLDQRWLSAEEQLSCEVLQWQCESGLEQLEFATHLLPLNQFASLHLLISQMAGGTSIQPFRTVQDYENWLRRLESFAAWCDSALINMRQGLKQGYVLPRALTEKTIPQITAMARGPAPEHPYYAPIRQMPPEIPTAEQVRLASAYGHLIEQRIIPTFQRLETFLQLEYQPASRASSGIDAIPNGPALYRSLVKFFTTTDMTVEEIHQLGVREVARLTAEMNQVREQVGFPGSLHQFFEHVRNRKELMPFTNAEQVIANFHAMHQRMEPQLRNLFSVVPSTAFEIRRTEAFREQTASAEYWPGSLDGSRPGFFYVPVPEPAAYNVLQDEALFLHEAIPGHHYQFSLQQENTALPMFRRILVHDAFGEGWALYCESLGRELGLYTDPYQYLGMLSMEMHRALRLVVDTGLHAKGWSREQAIRYSLEHEAESEAGIVAEIERYMALPGQALAYKVGQLKIRELRARAEKALGPQFDIREFHAQILESGCLPLQLLERKIDRWIETQTPSHQSLGPRSTDRFLSTRARESTS